MKPLGNPLNRSYAWAAVGKKSGKVLRDLRGHYAIFTKRPDAEADCPTYGEVRRVTIRVVIEEKAG